jgi:hypothetical protein
MLFCRKVSAKQYNALIQTEHRVEEFRLHKEPYLPTV